MGSVDLKKAEAIAEQVAAPLGCELVEARFVVENGRPIFRFLIDRAEGVTVGDCERFSRELDPALEAAGLMPGRYQLEVSSPGADRPLKKEADFLKAVGKLVQLKTREPIDGRRNYKGELKGLADGRLTLEIDHRDFVVPLALVERAKLAG